MTREPEAARNEGEAVGCLVTIGDEILSGSIPNGNAHYIASTLRSHGFRLDRIVTVGDREEDIVETLSRCVETGIRFLIVTGGLGPTDDDRTCAAVAKAFGRPLAMDLEYARWLEKRLAERGLAWTEHASKMAELPEGAVKIGWEMAGFVLEHRGIPCFLLPGVPHEMRTLMDRSVIPELTRRFPDRCAYVKEILRTQGLTESQLNRRLRNLACEEAGVEVGYLPQTGENWITLSVSAKTRQEATRRILDARREVIERIGTRHISGTNDESLEVVIGRKLVEKGWKLSLAESCTGGLVSRRITGVPGASDYLDRGYVTYSNRAKVDLLGVDPELIENLGAVSEPVARAMAEGARRKAGTDVAVSVTGIAGPTGGTPEKPVGTVFIACSTALGCEVEKHRFKGSRGHIRECAAQAALVLLWRVLSDDSNLCGS